MTLIRGVVSWGIRSVGSWGMFSRSFSDRDLNLLMFQEKRWSDWWGMEVWGKDHQHGGNRGWKCFPLKPEVRALGREERQKRRENLKQTTNFSLGYEPPVSSKVHRGLWDTMVGVSFSLPVTCMWQSHSWEKLKWAKLITVGSRQ